MAYIKRALLSVSDKRGLVEFAEVLERAGIELLSTGGTAKALRDAGLTVVDVSEYTESPEIMDGRVKTLHPRVHGGLLMRERDEDKKALAGIGGAPIDLVVVNLYPFEQTVARQAPHGEIIENIDIGGPSMIRSAAKNHSRVTVVVDPQDYARVAAAIETQGTTDLATRQELARKAFASTARYDAAIATYFEKLEAQDAFPSTVRVFGDRVYSLRYGENPHQKAAFYRHKNAEPGTLACAESIGSETKELSYNNFVDCDAALEAVREFERPAAVVVKHTNPCGVAEAETLRDAYTRARDADALSAFGGVVALNRPVDLATAEVLSETFLECIVAPDFTPDAIDKLRTKKNLRILKTGPWLPSDQSAWMARPIGGGFLVQERDASARGEVRGGKVVTARAPTSREIEALEFAWRVCKHVKSNAIVLADPSNFETTGVGAGQMSRVVSVQIALEKAGERARGSVLASDAFFPFADGVEAAVHNGITAIAQPGGSVRDAEVIDAANKAGAAMVFTGVRHFRH